MTRHAFSRLAPLLAPACLCLAAPAAAEDLFAQAERLCRAGQWAESLPVQRQVTASHPDHAIGWICLARSLHGTGKPREALPAYGRALELGALQPFRVMTDIARAHRDLGEKEAALDWLEKAVAAGAPSRQRLQRDAAWAAFRGEARFKAVALDIDAKGLSREEGWRGDLALLSAEISRLYPRPFGGTAAATFEASMRSLARDVGRLDDDEVAVRLMQALAPHADGHTRVTPPWRAGAGQRLAPIQWQWLDEGLVVTGVRPEDEALLWGTVTAVGGRPVAEALAAAGTLVSRDNDAWVKARAPALLRHPQALKPLGFATDPGRVELTVRTREGETRTATLEAQPPFRGEWMRVPPGHGRALPAWVARQGDPYWFEVRPREKLLYFQFNAVQDRRGGETLAAFAERLARAIDGDDVRHVVVDLRGNGGGNTDLLGPLLKAILATRKTQREDGLFVIAGRHTFSAAMNFAAQLERHGRAVFVGEPTGSRPNFVGENSELVLPYSRLAASISNLAWQNALPQDSRTWIAPRLPAPVTLASLREGRDPAMEAIAAHLAAAR